MEQLDPLLFGSADGGASTDTILHRFVAEDSKLHTIENAINELEQIHRRVVDLSTAAELKSDAVRALYQNVSTAIAEYRRLLNEVGANLTATRIAETSQTFLSEIATILNESKALRNDTMALASKSGTYVQAAREQLQTEIGDLTQKINTIAETARNLAMANEVEAKRFSQDAAKVDVTKLNLDISRKRASNKPKMEALSKEVCGANNVQTMATEADYLGVCKNDDQRLDKLAATLKDDSSSWLDVLNKNVFTVIKSLQLKLSGVKIKIDSVSLKYSLHVIEGLCSMV